MANDYFDSGSYTALPDHTLARSGSLNAIFAAVVAAFDKLPALLKLRQNRVTYVADTGTVNALVVTLDPAPPAYAEGLHLSVKIGTANTGPTTVNVNGLGAVAIKRFDGSDLESGDLPISSIVEMRHNGTNFRLLAAPLSSVAQAVAAAATATSAASTATTQAGIATSQATIATTKAAEAAASAAAAANHGVYSGTAGGTANNITLTPNPALGSYVQSIRALVKIASDNTDAVTLNVSSLGAVDVKKVTRAGVVALTGGELRAGMVAEFVHDGASAFILKNPADAAATGDTKTFFCAEANLPPSWIVVAAKTFGSASSGATYAGEKYRAIYKYKWSNLADAQFAVSGGRGANADADFDANKTGTDLSARGRAIFHRDGMGGSAANVLTVGNSGIAGDTLGAAGGSELMSSHLHTITHTHDMGNHTHGVGGFPTFTNIFPAGGGGQQFGVQSGTTTATSNGPSTNTTGASSAANSGSTGSGSSGNVPPALVGILAQRI